MKSIKKSAQSLIEYGLILALVAVVAVTILGKFGGAMNNMGDNSTNALNTASDKSLDNYCESVNKGTKWSKANGKCE